MKIYNATEGETWAQIYQRYYGELKTENSDDHFCVFLNANQAMVTLHPYKLLGGEVVILPELEELDVDSEVIEISDVGI